MSFDQDRRRKVYQLAFRPYRGLRISVRKPGFGALVALTRAVLVLGDDFDGDGLSGTDKLDAWEDLFGAFADSLISWDLTDRGRAVPATREGVFAQDHEFLLALARTWHAVVVLAEPTPDEPERPGPESEFEDHADRGWEPLEPELDEEYLAQLGAKAAVLPEPVPDLAEVT